MSLRKEDISISEAEGLEKEGAEGDWKVVLGALSANVSDDWGEAEEEDDGFRPVSASQKDMLQCLKSAG